MVMLMHMQGQIGYVAFLKNNIAIHYSPIITHLIITQILM